MPPSPIAVTALMLSLAATLAQPATSAAQRPAPPDTTRALDPKDPTPPQVEALAAFRPHAEQVCRALYLRPDAAGSCVERVLDAALPLDMGPAGPAATGAAPPGAGGGSTVAPDGRE